MRRLILSLCLLAFFSAGATAAFAAPEFPGWHRKVSPHFEILHESSWPPASISLEMERLYSSIRVSMAMFAPWMARERTKIYIYSSHGSYLRGEFRPPRWSKGLAYFSEKTVVVYDTGDIGKLKAVISHELSHLYLEGYFGEKLKYPPQWLNEGLAVCLEESAYPEGGPWSRALSYFSESRREPFDRFFDLKIQEAGSDDKIADWYLQAYATVLYLYRPHSRLQFKGFCDALRAGETAGTALWKAYRIRGIADLSLKWYAWLDSYGRGGGKTSGSGRRSASFNFVPVRVSSAAFHPFRPTE